MSELTRPPGTDEHCLTLLCPTGMEEKLLDLLLSDPGTERFIGTPTFSHGMAAGRLSTAEQVMGRSPIVQVQVLLDTESLGRLRDRLTRALTGSGVRWWVSPVVDGGEL